MTIKNYNKMPRIGLATKFNILMAVLISITATTVSFYALNSSKDRIEKDLVSNGVKITKLVANLSEFSLYTEDTESLDALLNNIVDEDISHIEIFNRDAVLISKLSLDSSFLPTKFSKYNDSEINIVNLSINGDSYIAITLSIMEKSDGHIRDFEEFGMFTFDDNAQSPLLGYVRLFLNNKRTREKIAHTAVGISIWTIVMIFISVWLTVILSRRITFPLQKLRHGTASVSRGEFNDPIFVNSNDEVGDLALDFNNMLNKLKDYRKAVESYQNTLEEMVIERTEALKKAHEELVRKQRFATLGQLTATVSHELRNPLAAIRPSIHILRKLMTESDDKRLQKAIERIDRNAQRCDQIIDELLDFTRMSKIKVQVTKIKSFIENVIRELPLTSKLTVKMDVYDENLEVEIDQDRFRRVLINIIDNACHAMCAEGTKDVILPDSELKISISDFDENIRIEIADSGSGIPENVMPKIFEPLFSTKGYGIGLGMPTVKQIIEQHQGTITVSSVVNKGTTITIIIPKKHSDDSVEHEKGQQLSISSDDAA